MTQLHDRLFYGGCRAYNTSSQRSRSMVQSWLSECLRDHTRCLSPSTDDWTPTRVLDIGIASSTTWKLCIPEEDGIRVPSCTTLSYRWGNTAGLNIPMLTTKSVTELRAGLDLCRLPQVFQGVISIVQELGIRFLWIGSLCIIQDVLSGDSENECAQMW